MKKIKQENVQFYETVLNKRHKFPDCSACNLRDYLRLLLRNLWAQGEGFSGKRPFGNSGWEHDIYSFLVKNKFVEGSLDENGYLEDYNRESANTLVFDLINYIFKKKD